MTDPLPETDIALLVDRFLRRIHMGVHEKAVAFDTARVGPGGGMILMTIADIEPAPIQELARRMARDKSQMTRALNSLESKGLITRHQSEQDARIYRIRLTAKGHDTVAGFRAIVAEAVDTILAPLSEPEQTALRAMLMRITEHPMIDRRPTIPRPDRKCI